jgi:ectoine hydroxylase-related dioxygenase (phytanoyl-CoA dioxygenase family)
MNSEFRIQNSELNGFGQFEQDGFQIVPEVLTKSECDALVGELSALFEQQQSSVKTRIGGVRNLLRASEHVAELASSTRVTSLLTKLIGKAIFPVRAIFFDKTAEANWFVPWHQDLAIAVAKRIETQGLGSWSVKDGALHVHPPDEILESMATLRLHLDDCNGNNGALRVLPGSHWRGKLGAKEISEWTKANEPVVCEIPKGGALQMRPLLLHASSASENPVHRRVLHLEYASQELPNGLKWFDH